ncbi:VanZ family protein [Aquabacterium sp. UBA2148]|uniref:VanZ family protein n=1 Tax=Aquabacterium sp. UBA2148 TaxID=1946042 RepID=UPI00257C7E1B|nr:VanZ family protein [Aquabacterium sp. UBA2148]
MALLAWVILQANTGERHPWLDAFLRWPAADKLGHFVLYGLLAACLDVAMRWRSIKLLQGWQLPWAGLLVLAFSFAEEASQLFTSTRSPDVLDLLANLLGVGVFCLLGRWVANRRG